MVAKAAWNSHAEMNLKPFGNAMRFDEYLFKGEKRDLSLQWVLSVLLGPRLQLPSFHMKESFFR